jgi:spore coat protein CotH
VFGLTKAKSWVLLANASDETMMRNIIAFEMGQRFGLPYTNHYIPVEVVINGKYQGSYVLTEQVQTGKGRVDIDEDAGFLVELDSSYDEEPKFRTSKIPFPVMIKSPETIINGTADNFVKTSLNGFIDTLFAGSFPDNGYRDMIDMDTFVNYIMIQEFMRNTDFWSLRSVYMYKDSAVGSKIRMGPLWDFDNTIGNPNERIPDSGEDYTQLGEIFFGRFFKDPVFRARYKELWDAHYNVIATDMLSFIDTEAAKLADSYRMNYYMWHGTYPAAADYTNIINDLKTWWNTRVMFMNGVIQ